MTNKIRDKTKGMFKKIKKFRKKHNSNWNIFLVCVCIVMIWRGVWNLLDIFVFPNNPFVSNIICILLWLTILLIDDWKLWELGVEPHKEQDTYK